MKVNRREGYRWRPRRWQPSAREKAVLDGLVGGKTNAEIGAELGMSADGVKWYVSELLSETGFTNRRELAGWWAEPEETVAAIEFQRPTMLLDVSSGSRSWTSTPGPTTDPAGEASAEAV